MMMQPREVAAALAISFAFAAFPALADMGSCKPDQHEGLICGAGSGAARVIDKTISPSKRLALAWRSPSDSPTGDDQPGNDDLETIVVRLSDGAILAKSPTEYWNTGTIRVNRLDEFGWWSPDSRLVIRQFDQRFNTETLELHVLDADDKLVSRVDLRKLIEPALQQQLRQRRKDPSDYVFMVAYAEPASAAIDNRGRVRTTILMWVPKDGPQAWFDVTVQVAVEARPLTARLVSIKPSKRRF